MLSFFLNGVLMRRGQTTFFRGKKENRVVKGAFLTMIWAIKAVNWRDQIVKKKKKKKKKSYVSEIDHLKRIMKGTQLLTFFT